MEYVSGGQFVLVKGRGYISLDVEDLCLIDPPFDHNRDGRHGKDHISNLLIHSERELANEGELLLHSGLHGEILEVGDVLLESVIGLSIFSLNDICLSARSLLWVVTWVLKG